jgi:hypothetical protein
VNLDTPIFTANACEGTTTLFETEYFGQKAFLAQSGQLYNEANIMSFGKVTALAQHSGRRSLNTASFDRILDGGAGNSLL